MPAANNSPLPWKVRDSLFFRPQKACTKGVLRCKTVFFRVIWRSAELWRAVVCGEAASHRLGEYHRAGSDSERWAETLSALTPAESLCRGTRLGVT
jgi:hypothetical protein